MPLFGAPNVEKLAAKGDIAGLIKSLQYRKDLAVCRAAALALGQSGHVQAVEPLIETLRESQEAGLDGGLRAAVLWALGKIGDERGLGLLIAALEDPAPEIRRSAASGLAHMPHTQAIDPLFVLLNRGDEHTAPDALQALGNIGAMLDEPTRQARIIEPLGDLLISDSPPIRAAAIQTLEATGWTPDQSQTAAAYWIARGEIARCVAIGAPAVPPLIAILASGDGETRKAAFLALVQIGAPAAPALIEAFLHSNTEIRQAAFHALVKIGPPAVPALIDALGHETEEVRLAIVRALGQIGDPRSVVPLIAVFRDPDWTIRSDAYRAIVRIGKPAVEQLVGALRHESDEIRWGAAGTLEAMGWKPDRGSIGATYWIVKGEWHKCTEIGAAAVPPLIERLGHWDDNVCKNATGALVRIGKTAVEPLIAVLKNENPGVRTCAATALGMIGDERAEQPLRELLSERNKDVSKAASEAISAIQTGEVWRGSS